MKEETLKRKETATVYKRIRSNSGRVQTIFEEKLSL
jgi:hypothetical protein